MSKRITELQEITTVLDTHLLAVVDEEDTKKATKANLLKEVVAALDLKADESHSHIIGEITGLGAALAGKSDIGHLHDDRYYTESEINAFNTGFQSALDLKSPKANPVFTGSATFDTDTFFVDGTNDRVGIGVASSLGAKLQINTGAATTVGQIIQGAILQSGNLSEWRSAAGAILARISSDANTFELPAFQIFKNGGESRIHAPGSQQFYMSTASANLRFQPGYGVAGSIFYINDSGYIYQAFATAGSTELGRMGISPTKEFYLQPASGYGLQVHASTTNKPTMMLKLVSSQTANAIEVRPSSSSTPIFHVNKDGGAFFGSSLDINSDIVRLRTSKTPASSGASGNQGDICWDSNYLYLATATNNWKRVALSAF